MQIDKLGVPVHEHLCASGIESEGPGGIAHAELQDLYAKDPGREEVAQLMDHYQYQQHGYKGADGYENCFHVLLVPRPLFFGDANGASSSPAISFQQLFQSIAGQGLVLGQNFIYYTMDIGESDFSV